MTAANHFAIGAVIGASASNPLIAVPMAIGSHFFLDALPHFGFDHEGVLRRSKSRLFQSVIILDAVLVSLLVGLMVVVLRKPELVLYSLLAFSPDLEWLFRYGIQEKFGTRPGKPLGVTGKLHAKIQTHETPFGLVPEAMIFVSLVSLLITLNY